MGERCLHVSTGAEACLEFDPMKIQNKRLQMDINEEAIVSRFLTKDSHNYNYAYTFMNIKSLKATYLYKWLNKYYRSVPQALITSDWHVTRHEQTTTTLKNRVAYFRVRVKIFIINARRKETNVRKGT